MSNEVVRNSKFNKLKTKVSKLDNKIPDATALILINQDSTDKQNLEKKMEMLIKNVDKDAD